MGEDAEPPNAARVLVQQSHETISHTIEAVARRLDSYFAAETVYEDPTGSFGQLTGIATLGKGGNVDLQPRARLNLVLPHTQRRLRFSLESRDDDSSEEDAAYAAVAKAVEPSDPGRKVFAGLLLSWLRSGKWTVNAGAGAHVKIPLDPYTRVRARYTLPLSGWVFRASETVFWFDSTGVGETSRVQADFAFSDRLLFRVSPEATYLWRDDTFELSTSVFLFQQLTERQGLAWQAGIFGETNPRWRRTGYLGRVRYRVQIYEKWIYAEVDPEVRWERDDGFRPAPFVSLRLDFLFGDEYE